MTHQAVGNLILYRGQLCETEIVELKYGAINLIPLATTGSKTGWLSFRRRFESSVLGFQTMRLAALIWNVSAGPPDRDVRAALMPGFGRLSRRSTVVPAAVTISL